MVKILVIKKTMVIFASGTLIVPTNPAGSGEQKRLNYGK